jgi:hypothetical protein
MDDRSISVPRPFERLRAGWAVIRLCESSRFQKQLLAQAYQQVFPQVRQSLGDVKVAARPCDSHIHHLTARSRRVGRGA